MCLKYLVKYRTAFSEARFLTPSYVLIKLKYRVSSKGFGLYTSKIVFSLDHNKEEDYVDYLSRMKSMLEDEKVMKKFIREKVLEDIDKRESYKKRKKIVNMLEKDLNTNWKSVEIEIK